MPSDEPARLAVRREMRTARDRWPALHRAADQAAGNVAGAAEGSAAAHQAASLSTPTLRAIDSSKSRNSIGVSIRSRFDSR